MSSKKRTSVTKKEVISMARPYSNGELRVLAARIMAGGHMDYQDAADFAGEFYRLTGIHRGGAALYMCAWRIENGYYGSLLS